MPSSVLLASTFYHHTKQSGKPSKDDNVPTLVRAIYDKHKGRYGYRRIIAELNNQGIIINHKRLQRLMNEAGLKARIRTKSRYNSYHGQVGKTCANLLNRDFEADKPNQKWATDVTEFKTTDVKGNTKKL
ncbi:MAG: IS3 family transposase [Moraxella sp.]|nr:IS3 family transposase [Moraxella sp.]